MISSNPSGRSLVSRDVRPSSSFKTGIMTAMLIQKKHQTGIPENGKGGC
jgi:hypothetical protein